MSEIVRPRLEWSKAGHYVAFDASHTAAFDNAECNCGEAWPCAWVCSVLEATKEWREAWDQERARADEAELVINAVTALRCRTHVAIPATIMPPETQECGLCMREEGILVGLAQAKQA